MMYGRSSLPPSETVTVFLLLGGSINARDRKRRTTEYSQVK
jgi:hypothetical protein